MSQDIIRKAQTGQPGNAGEFGNHTRTEGDTIEAFGVKHIDLTDVADIDSGLTDLELNDSAEYLTENKTAVADWVRTEYGAELEVDGDSFDDWTNARFVGGIPELHSDIDSKIFMYNLIGHLEALDGGGDVDVCAAVGHNVVGDESPYCVRCDEEFPELSTLEGAPDLDPAGHAPFYRAFGGGDESTVALSKAELTNNEELLNLYRPGQVVGYTWRGDKIPARQLVERMISARELAPAARDMPIADVIWQYTEANALGSDDRGYPMTITAENLRVTDDLSWLIENETEPGR